MELKQRAYIFTTMSLSRDGRYVVTGTTYNPSSPVRLWDVATGEEIWRVESSFAGITSSLGFSPDGKSIIAGGYDLALLSAETGKIIRKFGEFSLVGYHSTVFSPDGKSLLAGTGSGGLALWDVATGNKITDLTGHEGFGAHGTVNTVAFSPDGRYALSGGSDGTARLWDVSIGKNIGTFKHSDKGSYLSSCAACDVTAVMFMPESRRVASWGTDGTMKTWDTETGENIRTLKLSKERDGIYSGAVSSDWKYTVVGTHLQYGNYSFGEMLAGARLREKRVSLWDIATGENLREYAFETPEWSQFGLRVAVSADGKRVFLAGDAAMRILDGATLEEIAMLTAYEDGQWLVITSEGYYNSSEKGAQYLSVRIGEKSYGVDSFYDVFYRPDVVAAKLRGEEIKDLVTITMKDAIKSPPPLIEIGPVESIPASAKAKVCYNVKSAGGGIGEVRLFHNGKLIESDGFYREAARTALEKTELAKLDSKAIYENMRSVTIKEKADVNPTASKAKGEAFNDCKEIDAISGENEIAVTAFNKDNTVQGYMQTARFTSNLKAEEPHLYVLSIGIDRYKDSTIDLKYAAKDAADIKERILRQTGTIYKNIHHTVLTDAQATKANILGSIEELSKQIKPVDSFILFAAGHGVLLQNQYYMLTSEYDGGVGGKSLISSNEIVEFSKNIKSLNQLFIFDTCHAGGVDYIVSGLYDARMSVLAKKMGLHIYASASDKQSALDGYRGNGLFTYTLLEGLDNRKEADKNRDRQISLTELGEYSKQATAEISRSLGHVQAPLIINFGKDVPVYELR